jgi:hypothetical protein
LSTSTKLNGFFPSCAALNLHRSSLPAF